ncbi:Lipase maturation factor 2 [Balamuthia mandrillaris]
MARSNSDLMIIKSDDTPIPEEVLQGDTTPGSGTSSSSAGGSELRRRKGKGKSKKTIARTPEETKDLLQRLQAQDEAREEERRATGRSLVPYVLGRWLFLRGLAAVYLVAFASLYVQLPGLLGHDGILPADVWLRRNADHFGDTKWMAVPTVFWLTQKWMTVDAAMQLTCLLGMVLSSLVLLCDLAISPVFFLLWGGYLSLLNVGSTFLSFQWDILLVETGFIAIFLAPFWSSKLKRYSVDAPPSPVFVWLVRWLLFRLMFASGVVKLSSGCPTWWGLTALHYHYETQCIPTSVAWYAHHLPDCVQRLCVAIMFVIEVVVPFWFLIPNRLLLRTAALLQIILQVVIMLTGNYTFFNYLTIILSMTLLDDAFLNSFIPSRHKLYSTKAEQRSGLKTWLGYLLVVSVTAYFVAAYGFVVNGSAWDLSIPPNKANSKPFIKLRFNPTQWNLFLSWAVLLALAGGFLFFLIYSLLQIVQYFVGSIEEEGEERTSGAQSAAMTDEHPSSKKNKKRNKNKTSTEPVANEKRGTGSKSKKPQSMWRVFGRGLWRSTKAVNAVTFAFLIFSASTVPFSRLHQQSPKQDLVPALFRNVYDLTDGFHIVSNYGLFARMTQTRPEIIVEGSIDGKTWLPYEFPYKVGATNRTPPFIAPHQPRLDWQMWFAALGNYQNNPWFVNFLAKLFHNSSDVLQLLENNPFPDQPPKRIRARLFEYEFTKPLNGSLLTDLYASFYNHHLINEKVYTVNKNPKFKPYPSMPNKEWWTRAANSSSYLTLSQFPNENVEKFLAGYGWSSKPLPSDDLWEKTNTKGTSSPMVNMERWLLRRLHPALSGWLFLIVSVVVAFSVLLILI